MKLFAAGILTLMLTVFTAITTEAAFTKDAIDVSSINAMDIETSYGYTTVSVKAEICNNEQTSKVYVRLKGINWNGNELADVLFDPIVLSEGECRTVTDTRMIKTFIRNDIREWVVKSINRYRP